MKGYKIDIALKMKQHGMDNSPIADVTELSINKIEKITA
jgi:hypothetical protein